MGDPGRVAELFNRFSEEAGDGLSDDGPTPAAAYPIALDAACQRIAELEAELRWIPADAQRPPMDGDRITDVCSVDVLVRYTIESSAPKFRVGYWDRRNGSWCWGDNDSLVHPDVRITHWQEITPPEATDAD